MIDETLIFENRLIDEGNPAPGLLRGNPGGGTVRGIGIEISWQDGPLGSPESKKEQEQQSMRDALTEAVCGKEPNGASIESVIYSAIKRLQFFQDSKFMCRENALALIKLEESLMWLEARTKRRTSRKTEGTYAIENSATKQIATEFSERIFKSSPMTAKE